MPQKYPIGAKLVPKNTYTHRNLIVIDPSDIVFTENGYGNLCPITIRELEERGYTVKTQPAPKPLTLAEAKNEKNFWFWGKDEACLIPCYGNNLYHALFLNNLYHALIRAGLAFRTKEDCEADAKAKGEEE